MLQLWRRRRRRRAAARRRRGGGGGGGGGGGIFDLGAGMSLHVLWLEHEAQARPEARAASLWRLYWVPEKHTKTFSVLYYNTTESKKSIDKRCTRYVLCGENLLLLLSRTGWRRRFAMKGPVGARPTMTSGRTSRCCPQSVTTRTDARAGLVVVYFKNLRNPFSVVILPGTIRAFLHPQTCRISAGVRA